MAEKDPDEASLELPKLGFGRRKRGSKIEHEQESDPTDQPTEVFEAQRAEGDTLDPAPAPDPVSAAPAPAERPLYADEAPTRTRVHPVPTEEPAITEAPPAGERKADKPRREFTLPAVGGIPASLVTGLLVGLASVGLTGAGFQLCEAVQGTSSCGQPGFFLLMAILISMIYLGKALLKAFGLPDPGSTSFLAVGLLTVVTLLVLVDVLFSAWMVLVIPMLAMACYAVSYWATTSIADASES